MNLGFVKDLDWKAPFTRNLPVTIVTGMLAVILWVFVANQQINEATVKVTIAYANLPEGLALGEGTIDQVEVKFKGSPQAIGEIKSTPFPHHEVDVSGLGLGKQTLPLSSSDFNKIRGAQATTFEPQQLEVVLEKRITATLPIKVLTRGQPSEGYIISGSRVVPETVSVAGPELLLNGLHEVWTEEIHVLGNQNLTQPAQIVLHSPWLILLDTAPVKVEVVVTPELVRRTFAEVPVTIRNSPTGMGALGVRPEKILVEVEGPGPEVKRMTPADVQAYVDGSKPGFPGSPELKVDLPAGVTTINIEPPAVVVERR